MWAWKRPRSDVGVVTVAIDDGTVGVAAVVGLGVVTAMVGDPDEERALEGHGAGGAEKIGDPGVGLEAFVRKVAVEADACAHADDEVAGDEGDDLDGVDGMGAEPEQAAEGAGEGDANEEGIGDSLFSAGRPTMTPRGRATDTGWETWETATAHAPFLSSC